PYSPAITISYGSARTPRNAGRLRLRVLRAGVRAQGVDVRRNVIGLVPDDLLFEMLEVRPFQGRFERHDREFALVVLVFGLGAVFDVQPVAATHGNDEAVRHGLVVVLLPRLLDGQHVVEIEAVLVVGRGFGGGEKPADVERFVGGGGGHGRALGGTWEAGDRARFVPLQSPGHETHAPAR